MNTSRVKILFLHPSPTLYGADITLLQLVRGLDKTYFECTIALPTAGPLVDAIQKEGGRVFFVDMPLFARKDYSIKGVTYFFVKAIKSYFVLRKIVKDNEIEIVHSNTLAVFSGIMLAIFCKLKHVWHVHEIIAKPPLLRYLLPRLAYKTADIVIANSRQTAVWIEKAVSKENKNIRTIFNGVDASRFHADFEPYSFRRELNIASEEVLISTVGRISRLKGQAIFIRAAGIVLKEIKNVSFIIVGDPPKGQEHFLKELEELLEELPRVKEKMRIFSYREDINKVYSASDIVVVPSTEPESFGLVAIEAMACGKPVIASAHGGLLDIVDDGVTGLLVKPADKGDLANAIIKLIRDQALRRKLGNSGLERQHRLFSEERYIREVSSVYKSTIHAKEK